MAAATRKPTPIQKRITAGSACKHPIFQAGFGAGGFRTVRAFLGRVSRRSCGYDTTRRGKSKTPVRVHPNGRFPSLATPSHALGDGLTAEWTAGYFRVCDASGERGLNPYADGRRVAVRPAARCCPFAYMIRRKNDKSKGFFPLPVRRERPVRALIASPRVAQGGKPETKKTRKN